MRVTREPSAKVRDLIFINYRREDAGGYAGHLYERLCEHFCPEQVFRDLSSIPAGGNFIKYIREKIAESAAVLVVIGQEWLTCSVNGRRRLDDPHDFVRTEIVMALSDKDTLVIPVLVEDTKMPSRADLPDALKPLSKLQAFPMSDVQFEFDMERLLALLDKRLEDTACARAMNGRIRRAICRSSVSSICGRASTPQKFALRLME